MSRARSIVAIPDNGPDYHRGEVHEFTFTWLAADSKECRRFRVRMP
jgi:hypothetical protein